MRPVGRLLQMLGLAVPPLSMIMQLSSAISLKQMLAMLIPAICMFLIGRLIEGYSR